MLPSSAFVIGMLRKTKIRARTSEEDRPVNSALARLYSSSCLGGTPPCHTVHEIKPDVVAEGARREVLLYEALAQQKAEAGAQIILLEHADSERRGL